MRLDEVTCRRRLGRADHGVLATAHPERGADAVPVCFVYLDDTEQVAVPVDRVKPKASPVLQRGTNLDLDPRATLLCEQWDPDDWTRLWWVRATLRRVPPAEVPRGRLDAVTAALVGKYAPYRDRARSGSDPFTELLVFTCTAVSGWSGEA